MIYGVYAIRDLKTGFLTPTVDVNDQSAMRNFEHAVVSHPDSLFFSHPEDYTLFKLGEYDSDLGKLLPFEAIQELLPAPVALLRASQRVSPKGGIDDGHKA